MTPEIKAAEDRLMVTLDELFQLYANTADDIVAKIHGAALLRFSLMLGERRKGGTPTEVALAEFAHVVLINEMRKRLRCNGESP